LRYLAALLLVVYAFVNVLGAWAVIRRKALLAWLFMLAAALLLVSAITLVTAPPFSASFLLLGLVSASLASYLNARLVIGRVYWRNHLIRALVAVLLFLLAYWAR
jgi:hypothetical protein